MVAVEMNTQKSKQFYIDHWAVEGKSGYIRLKCMKRFIMERFCFSCKLETRLDNTAGVFKLN